MCLSLTNNTCLVNTLLGAAFAGSQLLHYVPTQHAYNFIAKESLSQFLMACRWLSRPHTAALGIHLLAGVNCLAHLSGAANVGVPAD